MPSAPPSAAADGGLSTMHPAELLGVVQKAIIERTGIDPAEIGQVVGGCVSQVGEQSFNVTRTAWLAAGLPLTTRGHHGRHAVRQQPAGHQPRHRARRLRRRRRRRRLRRRDHEPHPDRDQLGSKKLGLGVPIPKTYFGRYEMTSQFEGAERIADKWGITREDTDQFGLAQPAARRPGVGRGPLRRPVRRRSRRPTSTRRASPTGTTHTVARDEGLRETTLEKLATLKPVARENGVHTAGNSSQISDGASAVLLMTEEKAAALGLTPRARIVDTCLVGVDPVLMLTGPIDATQRLLDRTGLSIDDIDVFEINEAFASVVLAWQKEVGADLAKVNPNGGAIALGHPLGGTGGVPDDQGAVRARAHRRPLRPRSAMCCGGGLGTGTIIERL